MSCDQWNTLIDALQNFAFHDAIACKYTNEVGTLVTGMFVFGPINVAIYVRSGGITLPIVLTLILGGITLPLMPGSASAIALVILLVGIGVGPPLMLRRMGI